MRAYAFERIVCSIDRLGEKVAPEQDFGSIGLGECSMVRSAEALELGLGGGEVVDRRRELAGPGARVPEIVERASGQHALPGTTGNLGRLGEQRLGALQVSALDVQDP